MICEPLEINSFLWLSLVPKESVIFQKLDLEKSLFFKFMKREKQTNKQKHGDGEYLSPTAY